MHEHGPDPLQGPVRGSAAWWRATGAAPESATDADTPPQLSPPKKSRKPRDAKPIRQDLVDRVRKEIEAGTYETEEKWEAALERLLEHLHDD